MKKLIFLLLLAVFLLSTCSMHEHSEPLPVVTEPPSPSTAVLAEPEPAPEPEKSLPEGYTAQQIADFFCEVALDAEYSLGDGDSHALQKWLQPIYYSVYGYPSADDVQRIEEFAEQLNQVEGFPGMYPAQNTEQENCTIRFLPKDEMNLEASHVVNGEDTHGICQWDYYIDSNEIHTMRVWIRSDIEQNVRNSVILEEIINSLGMGNDSLLREDSIIYQNYSETQELSEMDWLLFEILYSEQMHCGMYEQQCREIIEKMYE